MSPPVHTYDGAVLMRAGKVAAAEECCCGELPIVYPLVDCDTGDTEYTSSDLSAIRPGTVILDIEAEQCWEVLEPISGIPTTDWNPFDQDVVYVKSCDDCLEALEKLQRECWTTVEICVNYTVFKSYRLASGAGAEYCGMQQCKRYLEWTQTTYRYAFRFYGNCTEGNHLSYGSNRLDCGDYRGPNPWWPGVEGCEPKPPTGLDCGDVWEGGGCTCYDEDYVVEDYHYHCDTTYIRSEHTKIWNCITITQS